VMFAHGCFLFTIYRTRGAANWLTRDTALESVGLP
jgi:hypothetical protein